MKKSISINIKGTIFNIEEDAFDVLKKYLDSIKKYFSTYEDSSEIYDDIETRVAEILHDKITKFKEVITSEDIESVIKVMGKIEDFEAQEEEYQQEEKNSNSSTKEQTSSESTDDKSQKSKRFFKDGKRKIVSGVCAGIAHYFSVDPFWIRLMFVISPFMTFGGALIIYIILAMILPVNDDLEESSVKKLYRDGEDVVLGGVSAGVAKYLGTDPVIIRILFVVLTVFAGVGVITYLILWVITPEAKSMSEKMQMEGEPITISNIEKNIKDNLNLKDEDGNESTIATFLLFPFRIISQLLNGVFSILKPFSTFLMQLVRFVGGFGFLSIGLVLMFSLLMFLAVMIGFVSGDNVSIHSNIPLTAFAATVPTVGLISGFLAGFFPSLLFILLGISLFVKRSFIKPIVFGSLFGLWILSIGVLAGTSAFIAKDYVDDAKVTKKEIFSINGDELVVELNENGSELGDVNLLIKTTTDTNFRLVQIIESNGATENEAKENAERIIYNYNIEGNILILDESPTSKGNSIFRTQDISLKLYIPEGKKVRITEELFSILRRRHFITSPSIYSDFGDILDFSDRVWMSKKDKFTCVNCEDIEVENDEEFEEEDNVEEKDFSDNSITFNENGFSKIEISDAFQVIITQGDKFSVKAFGNEDYLDDVDISKDDDWLKIEFEGEVIDFDLFDENGNSRDVKIVIVMPELKELDISGATIANVKMGKMSSLKLDLSGASQLDMKIETLDEFDIDMSGATQMDVKGRCEKLTIDVSGASSLDARKLIANDVEVEASGASTAKVFAKEKLNAEASGVSTIKYKGTPLLEADESGLSKIKKLD